MWEFFIAHQAAILAIGWGASELLAEIPKVKANSVFQLLKDAVGKAYGKTQGGPANPQ
jgi:hypothetical protein